MTLVLMAVGLMVAAVGLVAIGFGIPINAFSLGNTLIISGTVGLAGGLILIGLALVLGQLRRIVEALRGQPLARVESGEPVAAPASRATSVLIQPPTPEHQAVEPPRAPEPRPHEPRAPEPPALEPRAPEPRFPATASEPAPGPLDWLRVKSRPVTTSAPSAPMPAVPTPQAATESSVGERTDEAPISPRPPQRPAVPPAAEPTEPRAWSPGREASREAGPVEPRPAPRPEHPPLRAPPAVEPPKEKERFDLVWPDRGPAPAPAPVPSESKVEPKREPALEMPLPPIPVRPRETRPAAERRMPELPRKVERGPAILKSGVIDGMPYTLYADGSIEAQLPQGMVKFASVDALRAHLEKQG